MDEAARIGNIVLAIGMLGSFFLIVFFLIKMEMLHRDTKRKEIELNRLIRYREEIKKVPLHAEVKIHSNGINGCDLRKLP